MSIADINLYGWIFLVSLGVILIGLAGWYMNRSIIELQARVDRSEGGPKFSYLQHWLLPKYRAGFGRWANEDFHGHVDAKARNGISRFFLLVLAVGALIQIGLWVYLKTFVDGPISFLAPGG